MPEDAYDKPPMREWVHVPASAGDDDNELATLIAEALEFAGGLAPSQNIAPAVAPMGDSRSR